MGAFGKGHQRRLRPCQWSPQARPVFRAGHLRFQMADRTRGFAYGGLGAMHLLAQQTGLVQAMRMPVDNLDPTSQATEPRR